MFGVLSGFADEISPDLDLQIQTLKNLNMRYLEFRSAWETNVLKLSPSQVKTAKSKLDEAGIGLSAIGSPIGKIKITDDFEPHLKEFIHALDLAELFGAKYIRIFSYFIPEGANPAEFRGEVIRRMEEKVKLAEKRGIIIAHENEKHIYGDTGERCRDLAETINSEYFKLVFDPANYVQCELHPYDDCFHIVKPYLCYMHIKDANLLDGKVVPAGKGDGQFKEIFKDLHKMGFNSFLTMEPHLARAGSFDGFSGPDLFSFAVKTLIDLIEDVETL